MRRRGMPWHRRQIRHHEHPHRHLLQGWPACRQERWRRPEEGVRGETGEAVLTMTSDYDYDRFYLS